MQNNSIPFQFFDIQSHWLTEDENRYDAEYYAKDVISANVLMEKLSENGIEVQSLKEVTENIFWPGRFKRKYSSKKKGIPFLTPTEIFAFRPRSRKYVWTIPESMKIDTNWLLITRSGTVGRNIISTKFLEKYALSDDLIRVIPSKDTAYGYIYAYLNTWMGQAFLSKNKYGSSIKHIEPHHVETIPIPRIQDSDFETKLHRGIQKVYKLREEAQDLLTQAEEKLYSKIGLKEVDEDNVPYIGGEIGKLVNAFEIDSVQLNNRYDASYHIPIITQIETHLNEADCDVYNLRDYIKKIIIPPRFKRPYVKDPKYGRRYIRPSDLPVIKTPEKLYLAKDFKNSNMYILSDGEILVVTDGTIGWTSIVTPVIDGEFGSNNFARLTTCPNLDSGYLLVYLQSPYGQYQLKREIYGGVIDHLTEEHILNVKIPIPSPEVQKEIGTLVVNAYTKKDKANKIEQNCVRALEKKIQNITKIS